MRDDFDTRAGRMRIPRSRGAISGLLLVLLGAWGALIPFFGPDIGLAYGPDTPWTWTSARGWLEVLPGAVTVLGGLLLLMSANRAAALFGGWLTVVGGAWFVVGRLFASSLGIGDPGAPVATTETARIAVELVFFTGVGAVIIALGAMALGRLSVRSVRDIRYARVSVDEYHRDDYERNRERERRMAREPIARERVAVAATDADAEPPGGQRRTGDHGGPVGRRHRDWRHPFGGPRPVPH